MAVTVIHDEFELAEPKKVPDGTVLIRFREPDGTVHIFPVSPEMGSEFGGALKRVCSKLTIAKEMPDGRPIH